MGARWLTRATSARIADAPATSAQSRRALDDDLAITTTPVAFLSSELASKG
jgi:hypothetical protein